MKNQILLLSLGIMFLLFTTIGCERKSTEEINYKKRVKELKEDYRISTITTVPDSLKAKYRSWVIECVRAASQNMTGGDYEDVDETIEQAEATALKLFGIDEPALVINYGYSVIYLPRSKFTPEQEEIYDILMKNTDK